jgi:hypothetical protein
MIDDHTRHDCRTNNAKGYQQMSDIKAFPKLTKAQLNVLGKLKSSTWTFLNGRSEGTLYVLVKRGLADSDFRLAGWDFAAGQFRFRSAYKLTTEGVAELERIKK